MKLRQVGELGLGGFSQGSALALEAALKSNRTFAGVVVISSWYNTEQTAAPMLRSSEDKKLTPFILLIISEMVLTSLYTGIIIDSLTIFYCCEKITPMWAYPRRDY